MDPSQIKSMLIMAVKKPKILEELALMKLGLLECQTWFHGFIYLFTKCNFYVVHIVAAELQPR